MNPFAQLATSSLYVYIITLGIIIFIDQIVYGHEKQKSQEERNKLIKLKVIFLATIGTIICLAFYCIFSSHFWQQLTEPTFIIAVVTVVISLFSLFLADRLLLNIFKSEVVRRKLFHIGPILIIPLVN